MTSRPVWFRWFLVMAALVAAHAPRILAAELVPVTEEQKSKVRAALPTPAESAQPKQPRRLLVFWRTEGFVHACIPVANFALEEMGRTTGAYAVESSTDMAAFTTENLARFDGVLFNNSTRLAFVDPVHRASLIAFIEERGAGLIAIHAGADNFYTFPEACAALGGQFDAHPWLHDGTWAVKLDEPEHPANTSFGGRGFWINDEIYQIGGPYSRETHRVLLSMDMSQPHNHEVQGIKRTDGDFPIAWLKHAGLGRVFYCSLGHNEHIYWNPAVLRHYLAGIQYALGDRELPDAPSAALKKKPEPALAPGKL